MKKMMITICCFAVMLSSVGCSSMPDITGNKKADGGFIGGVIGALAGQLILGDTRGTLIGAAVGAGVGYVLTPKEDKPQDVKVSEEFVEVQVTNSNGSVIFVGLKKKGAGYIGPKGEYYSSLPSAEQLKPIYGF